MHPENIHGGQSVFRVTKVYIQSGQSLPIATKVSEENARYPASPQTTISCEKPDITELILIVTQHPPER